MNVNFEGVIKKIVNYNIAKSDRMTVPHVWFAWHPVEVGLWHWVIFEKVVRKYKYDQFPTTYLHKRYYAPSYEKLDDAILRNLKK